MSSKSTPSSGSSERARSVRVSDGLPEKPKRGVVEKVPEAVKEKVLDGGLEERVASEGPKAAPQMETDPPGDAGSPDDTADTTPHQSFVDGCEDVDAVTDKLAVPGVT